MHIWFSMARTHANYYNKLRIVPILSWIHGTMSKAMRCNAIGDITLPMYKCQLETHENVHAIFVSTINRMFKSTSL